MSVYIEYMPFCFDIWKREFNFSINTTRTNQCWIQTFNFIGCHNYFHVSSFVKPIQLVEEFQHGTLNFTSTSTAGVITLGTDGIDFVNKYNGGTQIICYSEKLPHKFGSITKIFLNQFGSDHTQKGAFVLLATAFAKRVFPVPGSPYKMTPLG